ncbi:MAG: hydantoinase/oxoprolinase family protein [Armatimonadetes bacterium]|nr:hydantoinase/oxoprolinase family protein [Armatimonadota bacterium]NIM24559.1 hydantoinase/oxoprolinase family protein [Armatimonadota bacterium]NIM68435.1 hydantoinase/oxoprolinase family protein [Armatimonadota bacterium]NIM76821.1 hydantoinase/oxoprolinase family protein [Armatimonadota bacterium]NIN06632.1 hydantoinase/oxoprolinase family protein [Armatimonadota bacterium]
MAWRIGIDIGGTFTDLVAANLETGETCLYKSPTTPANLAQGVAAGLAALGEKVPLRAISFLAHGTTAGTNALIEEKGARTGLITTDGFRDLLEIARQQRPSLYDLRARKPRPLIPRRLRREVVERMQFDGSILKPLDVESVKRELALLAEEGIESLAICLLHSYANSSHERAVRDMARESLPDVYVTASCDLLPRFREYERLSTTVINTYLGPLMNGYLNHLSERIMEAGISAAPHIMQSNGGIVPLEEARLKPAGTVLSGPAAGAAAAADLSARLDIERAIAIDMGGTSTDVCLIEGGLPASAAGRKVGGYAVELPGVDVRCIGAGGGSLLWVDAGGLLNVGPHSAGAHPGPACYAQGGEEPAITDAFLVLGRIPPSGLLQGEMTLDPEAARKAVTERIAAPLEVSLERAALGAVELTVANVRRAIETITVAEGRDPREFSLIAAGGAGPLIAAELAAEMQIDEVIIPASPGNFSAGGLLVSDLRRDWVRTHLMAAAKDNLPELIDGFHSLEREACEWLADNLVSDGKAVLLRRVAARYVGQDYELEIEVPSGRLTERELDGLVADFHQAHERHYGYALPGRPIEFVDLMITAVGQVPAAPSAPSVRSDKKGAAKKAERSVYLSGKEEFRDCAVYDRANLGVGEVVEGPGIIEQYDSTTYLPAACRAHVDEMGNLRLTRNGRR